MGLCGGKAYLLEELRPFTKFSRATILKVTTAYHNISDGFGVSISEFCEILSEVNDSMQMSKDNVKFLTRGFFHLLDTDNNGLIDGLETLSLLAIISAMYKEDIIEYILSLYDFSNVGSLTCDEVILALKSSVNGLLKVQNQLLNSKFVFILPADRIYDEIASAVFLSSEYEPPSFNDRMEIRSLTLRFLRIPEIASLLEFFNDVDYFQHHKEEFRFAEKLLALQLVASSFRSSSSLKVIAMNGKSTDQGYQWKSQVALLTPVDYANVNISKNSPSEELRVDWIYGLECRKGLRKVDYTKTDEIIYSVGRYIIIYSHQTNTQRVMAAHFRNISHFQVHRDTNIIVSGEIGVNPTVLVWNCESTLLKQSFELIGGHSVTDVAFSMDGSLILIIDDSYVKNFILWDWKNNSTIYRGVLEASLIFSCAISSGNRFAIAHDERLTFWTRCPEGFICKQAVWVKNRKTEVISSMIRTVAGENIVCGSVSGALLLFHGYSCVRYVLAHSGAITAIVHSPEGYITSSKDSRIRVWTSSLEPRYLFDISKFSALPSVGSLSLSSDASMILLLTLDSEIFEISALDGSDLRGGPLVQGHRFGEIYDLDTHPSKLEAISVGSDRTLRVYDLKLRSQIKIANLAFEATAIAYSPLGDTIAVGASCHSPNDYKFVILSEESLNILHTVRDTESVVSTIKFSVDGEILAVGCKNGGIYLYSVPDDYELVCKCSRHSKSICAIDFSQEGEWLRSNCVNGELHFFSVDDGSYQSNLASLRDVKWSSQDCIYSWHTKGIHQGAGSVVVCTTSNSENPHIVAVGDTNGSLKVYSYPSIHEDSEFLNFHLHTAKIVKVRFSFDNSILLCCGSEDRCIVQFDVQIVRLPHIEHNQFTNLSVPVVSKLQKRVCATSISVLNDIALKQEKFGHEWDQKVLQPPETFSDRHDIAQVSICLERVYGFEGTYCLSNIFYISAKEVIYTSGRFALQLNKQTDHQKIFQSHLSMITAICVSHCKTFVATSDLSRVMVWNSDKMDLVFSPIQPCNVAATALAFSYNDRLLMILVEDDFHSMYIYDWKHKILLSKTSTGLKEILCACFSEEIVATAESRLAMTAGRCHLKFWKNVNSNFLFSVEPDLQDLNSSISFTCCHLHETRAVVGNDDGYLVIFQNCSLQQKVKAHTGSVSSLAFHVLSKSFYSAGHDGVARLWNDNFECLKEINLENYSKNSLISCKAVAISPDNGCIAIGTIGGEILEIDTRRSQLLSENNCSKGHVNQLSGLAVHPSLPIFATTSDDGMLRIWNSKTFSQLKSLKLDLSSRAVDFSADGALLAIGFGNGRKVKGKAHAKEGSVVILHFDNLRVVQEKKDGSGAILSLKFSPNGKWLIAGSDDCCIYIYGVDEGFVLKTIVRTHEASVIAFDFTADSSCLLSLDDSNKVCFSTLPLGLSLSGLEQSSMAMYDHCIPVSWYAKGLWFAQPSENRLVSLAKCRRNFLVTGANDMGQILLSRFPVGKVSGLLLAEGHSGEVSAVRWLADGESFISIGKWDCCSLQWRVVSCGNHSDVADTSKCYFEDTKNPQTAVYGEDQSIIWKGMIAPNPATLSYSKLKWFPLECTNEFVQGISGEHSNRTVSYNSAGEIVYFTGKFAIVYNRNSNSQKFYAEHYSPISCLKLNYGKSISVTGDESGTFHIWDALLTITIARFTDLVAGRVKDADFSKSGHFLAVLASDVFQSIVLLYSPSRLWSDGRFHCSVGVGCSTPVTWGMFFLDSIVVGGTGPISVFQLRNGSLIRSSVHYDEQLEKSQEITCGIVVDLRLGNLSLPVPCMVYGSSQGFLYIISQEFGISRYSAHDEAVTCISENPLSSLWKFVSIGKDSKIKFWSSFVKPVRSVDLLKINTGIEAPLRFPISLACSGVQDTCLIHFSNAYLIEMTVELLSFALITEGHYGGELHALCFNPLKPHEYVTFGDDGIVRVWNWERRYCSKRKSLPFSCRVIKATADSKSLVGGAAEPAITLKNPRVGVVFVLDADSLEILREEKKSKFCINDIQLFAQDSKLGVATGEGIVLICDFKTLQTLDTINLQYSRPATGIDFSFDDSKIRISFAPDRMTYYDLHSSTEVRDPANLSALKWNSTSWKYSWEVQGLHLHDYGDVTAVCVNPPYVFAGFQNGDVRLFPFPCIEKQIASKLVVKLSSHASALSVHQSHLLVLDAKGRSLLQINLRPLPAGGNELERDQSIA